MKIILMYTPPHISNLGTKFEYEHKAIWELFIDTGSKPNLPFGRVDIFTFHTHPTKRQIRQAKKQHRKNVVEAIEAREWEDSWEGIHCDIISL